MSDSWEALPQRPRRHRPTAGSIQTATSASADTGRAQTIGSVLGGQGLWSATAEQHGECAVDGGGKEGRASNPPPRKEQGEERAREKEGAEVSPRAAGPVGGGGGAVAGDGESGGDGNDAVVARHAAVVSAVEERSRMSRFAGGLESRAGVDGANFEYLDHTADVQLHSWGDCLERAMEGALEALFNVMTDIGKVEVDPSRTREMEVKGHDVLSLLFSLLDEFLFAFHADGLVVKRATVGAIDRDSWKLTAKGEGEAFDLGKHPQGTEVKAITYSNMQVNEDSSGRVDIYVIIDI